MVTPLWFVIVLWLRDAHVVSIQLTVYTDEVMTVLFNGDRFGKSDEKLFRNFVNDHY